jgi:hypothetical protein
MNRKNGTPRRGDAEKDAEDLVCLSVFLGVPASPRSIPFFVGFLAIPGSRARAASDVGLLDADVLFVRENGCVAARNDKESGQLIGMA